MVGGGRQSGQCIHSEVSVRSKTVRRLDGR